MNNGVLTFRNMARVTFSDWRKAADFAFIIAPQSDGVRVSKIRDEWAVEWKALNQQPTYVPGPTYPAVQPWIITNTGTSVRGAW